MTYAELKEFIDRFATGLSEIGVKRNDKVIIYLSNTPQFVIAFYAIMSIGAVPVPISPIYTPVEVRYMSGDCAAETIICHDTNFGYVKEVMARGPLKRMIHTNLIDMLPWWKKVIGFGFDKVPHGRVDKGQGVYPFTKLLKYPPTPPKEETGSQEDICRVLYTGGTTGLPKGVPSSYAHLYYGAKEVVEVVRGTHIMEGRSRIVLILPLYHALCQAVFSGLILALGNTAILMPRPEVDAILEAIQRYRADIFLGVPTLYRMIMENDRLDQYDLGSLKFCWSGGDVLPVELFNRWERKFSVPLHQLYGSTEGELHSSTPMLKSPRPKSVGVYSTSTGKKYRLVDPDTLETVPERTPGELLVSAPFFLNYYLNKPEETADSYVKLDGDTYYRTRDMLMMEDEELYFVDRSADVIKHKGYRVSASEIEAVLQDHHNVIGACAVGVPDPKVGERIKVFVVLKEAARGVSAHDLIRWCRESLAPYKVPQYIEFRDMLPKSKVGKLLRREMRDEERRKMREEEGEGG
jgi:long-chain acyl-CoA synthetase